MRTGWGGSSVRFVSGRLIGPLLIGMIVLAGCVSAPAASPHEAAPQETSPGTPRATTTLRIASLLPSNDGISVFTTQQLNQREIGWTFHAGLTAYDGQGILQGHLARKVPSIADGDWTVHPD